MLQTSLLLPPPSHHQYLPYPPPYPHSPATTGTSPPLPLSPTTSSYQMSSFECSPPWFIVQGNILLLIWTFAACYISQPPPPHPTIIKVTHDSSSSSTCWLKSEESNAWHRPSSESMPWPIRIEEKEAKKKKGRKGISILKRKREGYQY